MLHNITNQMSIIPRTSRHLPLDGNKMEKVIFDLNRVTSEFQKDSTIQRFGFFFADDLENAPPY